LNFQVNYILNRTDLIQEKETIHVKLNSIGYNNFGTEWDDGGHQKMDKIIVGTRNSIISSIRVVYEEPDETKVLGLERGGQSSSLKVVTL
jgi:Jacalin-like lectin domain